MRAARDSDQASEFPDYEDISFWKDIDATLLAAAGDAESVNALKDGIAIVENRGC